MGSITISQPTSNTLSALADTLITSITDNEILQYNSGSSIWENQTLAEAGISAVGHTHTESDITDLQSYLLDTTDTFTGVLTLVGSQTISGDLTVDTSTLYVDSVNNRVGIGTTAPDGTLHVYTASAGAVTANANADDLIVEGSSAVGISLLTEDANNADIIFGSPADNLGALIRWNYNAGLMSVGASKAGADLRFLTGAGVEGMRINSTGNVGVGVTAPSARVHIDQDSATGAEPVLYLDQADLSEEFIRFDATEATGNPIEDVGAKSLTVTKFIRVNINGTDLYLQAGTIA